MGTAQSKVSPEPNSLPDEIGRIIGSAEIKGALTDIKHYEQGYYSFGSDESDKPRSEESDKPRSEESDKSKTYNNLYKILITDENLKELKTLESLDLAFRRDKYYYVYDQVQKLKSKNDGDVTKLFVDWILPGRLRRIRILRDSLPDTIAEEDQLSQQILEIEQQIEELKNLMKIKDIK
jgi:hypothetical protein